MTDQARAVAFVLRWEGEWSDDPADPGHQTRWGISQASHPGLDLTTLSREAAVAIYEHDYWRGARCDQIPWPLSLALFDGAVQHGPAHAVRMLQAALHVTADGLVGPATIAAARMAPAASCPGGSPAGPTA